VIFAQWYNVNKKCKYIKPVSSRIFACTSCEQLNYSRRRRGNSFTFVCLCLFSARYVNEIQLGSTCHKTVRRWVLEIRLVLHIFALLWVLASSRYRLEVPIMQILYGAKERSSRVRLCQKWTDLNETWNIVIQMLGAGPDRFWARSAQ